jgi:hypothetical protein
LIAIGRRRLDHLLFDVVGAVCLVMGLYKIVASTRMTLNYYDEGILLSHTRTLDWGGWPYRDFYTQYPPGIYFLLRGLWQIFGPHVLVGRYLSDILRIGIGVVSGFVGGRLASRRVALLPAGLVMCWLGPMWTIPYAWLVALLCALGSTIAIAWAARTGARDRLMVVGLLLGATASFRHDLFIYYACGLAVPTGFWIYQRRAAPHQVLRAAGWIAAGAAVPLIIFWLPTLLHVPWKTIYKDIYADQVRHVLPARKVPLPPMTDLVVVAHLPWRMPAFLVTFGAMTFGIILAAPVLGALAVARARRGPPTNGVVAASLTALAVAVLPQALGRSDWFHGLCVVAPGALLAGALPYTFRARQGWPVATPALLLGVAVLAFGARALQEYYPPTGPLFPTIDDGEHDGSPLTHGIADVFAEPRRRLRAFLATVAAAGEPIFAGNSDHALLAVNEVDLFFVIDHPSATRYLQFDPGIVTREEVQREMVADLEKKKTRIAILSVNHRWTEPCNESSKRGSTFLDDYLRANYHVVRTIGPYEVRLRD